MTCDERYPFRYRLLASADIVGSTAFKNHRERSTGWAHVFRNFFNDFPRRLLVNFEELPESTVACPKPANGLKIWKFVGDEILFWTELRRHEETIFHVLAFKAALDEYSQELAKHPGLGLKGTIWGAGFPVLNVEVDTKNADGERAIDFLGPSVDLGFRLASHADLRKLPLSADIAHFVLTAYNHCSIDAKACLVPKVDPPQVLKGIAPARGYPLISLDRRNRSYTAEDRVLGRTREWSGEEVLAYLDELFVNGEIQRPFITDDPSDTYNKVPPDFEDARRRLVADDPESQYEKEDPTAMRDPEGDAEDPPPPASIARSDNN